jgi:multicomponent Na+:H+ antiporter subunit F
MTIALYIAVVLIVLGGACVIFRIVIGPSDPDRAVAADLLLGTCIALFIVFGLLADYSAILDVLLVVSCAGFLSSLALARLILRDEQ